MAAGDIIFFREGVLDAVKNWIAADDIKVAYLKSTTTVPVAGATAPELADYTEVGVAGSYVAGGVSVGIWGNFLSLVGNLLTFKSAAGPNVALHASNDTDARYFLYYNDTQTGKPCLGFVDLGADYDMTLADTGGTQDAAGMGTIDLT